MQEQSSGSLTRKLQHPKLQRPLEYICSNMQQVWYLHHPNSCRRLHDQSASTLAPDRPTFELATEQEKHQSTDSNNV